MTATPKEISNDDLRPLINCSTGLDYAHREGRDGNARYDLTAWLELMTSGELLLVERVITRRGRFAGKTETTTRRIWYRGMNLADAAAAAKQMKAEWVQMTPRATKFNAFDINYNHALYKLSQIGEERRNAESLGIELAPAAA